MTRWTAVARFAAAALVPLSMAACSGTRSAAREPTATAQATLPQSPAASATEPATTPSGPPLDLRSVGWSSASIPGQFCYVPATVKLKGGHGTGSSSRWGHVQFYAGSRIAYGNLGKNVGEIAAMQVMCMNDVPTAAGQLVDSYIIFTGAGGKLTAIGVLTPQEQPSGVHISLVNGITISPGAITVKEDWYRPNDATCCPTGRATTVWTYANGKFTPGAPDITA